MASTVSRESLNRRFNDSVEGMATDIKDTARAVDAASLMGLLSARPRLLALGEPTHGEDDLLELRNELFRQLVEQEGYRTIAIESDCLMGLVVDDYVTTGTGSLDEAVEHGISHGWSAYPANRELVRWMRAYNDGRLVAERVRFAGFRRPAGDHRRREPPAGPHRAPRLSVGPRGRGPLPAPRKPSTACSARTPGGPIPPR
ncbi:hypothetical protein SGLAM104S_10234 [Streptomyces glaucescens]